MNGFDGFNNVMELDGDEKGYVWTTRQRFLFPLSLICIHLVGSVCNNVLCFDSSTGYFSL